MNSRHADRHADRRADRHAELHADCGLSRVVRHCSVKCLQTIAETVEYGQHLRINLTLRLGAKPKHLRRHGT
jgi:hypothetical protein